MITFFFHDVTAAPTLNPKNFHGRLITLVMFMTSILLNVYFASILISSLTLYSPTLPFKDIYGLYNARNEYSFKFAIGAASETLLKVI